MQVQTADAPARTHARGTDSWFFCSDRCRERFEADPGRYAAAADAALPPTT